MLEINTERLLAFLSSISPTIFSVVMIIIVLHLILGIVAYSVLAERRLSAFIQDRLGPNRVGYQGLLQPLADGLKFIFKEDVIPDHVNKVLYCIAPVLILVPVIISFAVIPFGNQLTIFGHDFLIQIADLNIGILYILGISLLGAYGIILAGWASNNKFSLLGGMRSAAQMISYEVSLGLSVLGVIMITGSFKLNEIVLHQAEHGWNVIYQFPAMIIFFTAMLAETNRLPFDFPEAEPELVAGYHTEYSSFKFALFFMAEYASMLLASALVVTLFLGGWHVPLLSSLGLPENILAFLGVGAFLLKTILILLFIIQIRWTLPRFRYDQLMKLGWKILLPIALANVFLTGIVMYVRS